MTTEKKPRGLDVPRSITSQPGAKILSPTSVANMTGGSVLLMDSNANELVLAPGKNRASLRSSVNSTTGDSGAIARRSAPPRASAKVVTLPPNIVAPALTFLPTPPAQHYQNYQLSAPYYLPNQPNRPAVYQRMVNPAPFTSGLPALPQTSARTAMVKSTIGFDRNRNVRIQVERAIREHKIFSCVGVYPAVRKALQKRGWVEKSPSLGVARSTNLENVMKELETRGFTEESDQSWMNRVLREYPPDLIWVIRRDNIDWRALHKDQIVNRFPRAFFTTKVGIAACLQSVQWFSEAGVSDTFFPRCYRLCVDEERSAFVDDYRLTACMGLLKWVVEAYEKDGEEGVMDSSSRITSLAVDFAVRQVNNYVRMRRHEDIDWLMPPAFMGQHWDVFLSQYYNVVLLKSKLAPNDHQDTGKLKYEAAKKAISRLVPYWPQLTIDGTKNIWICKPGARSRGKGIIIMNQLDKILELLAQSNHKEANWVVQKYIERPLIIYNTKFDIRQWFVVSDWNPLTVWFYKESYIRFCTKPFSLDDFHESIHLCNNAIQCRYQNSEHRDTALPEENMWDCYTFQSYLRTLGKMDAWDSVIYPGMKQCIIGVLLASQETVDFRKNCFELYGADFMLSEDLRPWLIEINSCPCMAPSTSVTARMCAQCLEDTIKVIVDRREDRDADTGMFEMIYRQTQSTIPMPFNGLELVIQGKKLTKEVDFPKAARSNHKIGNVTAGLTFTDLVHRLRLRDAQGASNFPQIPVSSVGVEGNNTARSVVGRGLVLNGSQALPSSPAAVPGKLTSEDRMNENSIISIKKLDVHKLIADKNAALLGSSTSSLSNKFSNAETGTGLKKDMREISSGSKESLRSKRSTGLRSRTGRNKGAGGGGMSPSHNQTGGGTTGETLLSTLLQNSASLQPTVADLVRLTQRMGSKSPADISNSASSKTSSDSRESKTRGKDTGSGGNAGRSKSSSGYQLPLQPQTGSANSNITGKIRPNARTTVQLPLKPAEKLGPYAKKLIERELTEGNKASLKSGKMSPHQIFRLMRASTKDPSNIPPQAKDTRDFRGSPPENAESDRGQSNDDNSSATSTSVTPRSSSRGSSSVDHVEIVIFLEPQSGRSSPDPSGHSYLA